MPFLLATLLGDEWAQQRLALIYGEQIFENLQRLFIDGRGFDEDVKDRGKNLSGQNGVTDFDCR